MVGILWSDILKRCNETSKQLQSVEIDLETVVSFNESSIQYELDLKSMFDIYEERGLTKKSKHKTYRQIRERKRELIIKKIEGEINFEIRDYFRINAY